MKNNIEALIKAVGKTRSRQARRLVAALQQATDLAQVARLAAKFIAKNGRPAPRVATALIQALR